MIGLTLGSVSFRDFELPGAIAFGGRQALKVHRLPGGGRVIDTLGRDDADIGWAGVLAGGGAADRARVLDRMRADGGVLPLQWDAFSYLVVISDLHLSYRGPWWIPYRIRCTVLADQAAGSVAPALVALPSIASDLAAASALVAIGPAAGNAVQNPGALQVGTFANAEAVAALGETNAAIGAAIVRGEAGMAASDVMSVAASAGAMANATAAKGYVGRALDNLLGAEG